MPKEARIFHADDDAAILKTVKEVVEKGGHHVVSQASTLQDALDAIGTFEQQGINVAILDGNLGENSQGSPRLRSADGLRLQHVIRTTTPGVKIFGLAGDGLPGADVDVNKYRGIPRLARIINRL